jgi:hypothetical protein
MRTGDRGMRTGGRGGARNQMPINDEAFPSL